MAAINPYSMLAYADDAEIIKIGELFIGACNMLDINKIQYFLSTGLVPRIAISSGLKKCGSYCQQAAAACCMAIIRGGPPLLRTVDIDIKELTDDATKDKLNKTITSIVTWYLRQKTVHDDVYYANRNSLVSNFDLACLQFADSKLK